MCLGSCLLLGRLPLTVSSTLYVPAFPRSWKLFSSSYCSFIFVLNLSNKALTTDKRCLFSLCFPILTTYPIRGTLLGFLLAATPSSSVSTPSFLKVVHVSDFSPTPSTSSAPCLCFVPIAPVRGETPPQWLNLVPPHPHIPLSFLDTHFALFLLVQLLPND